MKKKAIKIAASTAVAASAFVAAAPAQQADAATNVNQLVTDAQNAGTVLKWAISVEGSADYKTRPYDQYNAAKKAIKAAEAAAAKLSGSEKLSVQAKLVEPKLQEKRAAAYIDAITSSEKIKDLTSKLDAAIKTDDIEKVETAYHAATGEYRKQAALLDRVYGQSTRDGIRNAVKPTIEKLVASVKNEVTVNMLAKAASANGKAGKLVEAAQNLSDAQAILDANVLKWETSLQKSVDDVTASLPLQVLTVSSDNVDTVTVKFSKKINDGYSVLPAGQFTFTNGLIVQSATVAADGKTVTLKTTAQAKNTEYALSYQGSLTGKSFKTPANAVDGTLNISETDVANLDNGTERAYTVNVTKADGTAYTGKVKIDLYNALKTVVQNTADVKVRTVNGVTAVPDVAATATYTVNAVNGKVTFVVADVKPADATLTVVPKVTRLEDASHKFAPATTFWALATASLPTSAVNEVTVDEKNGFLYLNTGVAGSEVEQKFFFDSNDKFYFKNVEVSQADFFKALSEQDVVTINYAVSGTAYNKAGISEFVINTDVTADAALKVTNPSAVLTVDTNATRLAGTSQANHIIEVYKGTTVAGTPVASTTVSSNGSWVVNSLNLDAATQNQFVVTSRPVGSAVPTSTSAVINIYQQYFATTGDNTAASTGLFVTDTDGNSKVGIGDVITFSVNNPLLANNNLKVDSNAKITLQDDQGYTRYYNVAKVTGTTNQVVVTGVETKATVDGYNAAISLTSGNTLLKVEGITNQDNLLFNVKESGDVKLDAN